MGTVFSGGGKRERDQRPINENSLGLDIWLFVKTSDNKWNINHGRVKPVLEAEQHGPPSIKKATDVTKEMWARQDTKRKIKGETPSHHHHQRFKEQSRGTGPKGTLQLI